MLFKKTDRQTDRHTDRQHMHNKLYIACFKRWLIFIMEIPLSYNVVAVWKTEIREKNKTQTHTLTIYSLIVIDSKWITIVLIIVIKMSIIVAYIFHRFIFHESHVVFTVLCTRRQSELVSHYYRLLSYSKYTMLQPNPFLCDFQHCHFLVYYKLHLRLRNFEREDEKEKKRKRERKSEWTKRWREENRKWMNVATKINHK